MLYMEGFGTVTHSPMCKGAQQGDHLGIYTCIFSTHTVNSKILFVAPLGNNQRPRVGGPDFCLDWKEQTTAVAYYRD